MQAYSTHKRRTGLECVGEQTRSGNHEERDVTRVRHDRKYTMADRILHDSSLRNTRVKASRQRSERLVHRVSSADREDSRILRAPL